MPSTFGKRSTGFGIGHRFKTPIAKRESKYQPISKLIVLCFIASPDPGNYNLISDFDIGKPGTANIGTKRGVYSMGRKCKNPEDPMSKLGKFDEMPGPGAYTSKLMTIGHSGPMFNL